MYPFVYFAAYDLFNLDIAKLQILKIKSVLYALKAYLKLIMKNSKPCLYVTLSQSTVYMSGLEILRLNWLLLQIFL